MIDRFTRRLEVFPLRLIADAVDDTFSYGWIARFGFPSVITTDDRVAVVLVLRHIHTVPRLSIRNG